MIYEQVFHVQQLLQVACRKLCLNTFRFLMHRADWQVILQNRLVFGWYWAKCIL